MRKRNKTKKGLAVLLGLLLFAAAAGCAAEGETDRYTPETYTAAGNIIRGGFWAPDRTEDAYSLYKKAGFNTVLLVRHETEDMAVAKADNYYLGSAATAEALALCKENGLKAYLNYGQWESTTAGDYVSPQILAATAEEEYAPYLADGTIVGMHMADEPYKGDMDSWLGADALAQAYSEKYAGKKFFTNLHPWIFFATNNGFGMGLTATYQDYVEYYVNNVLLYVPQESRLLSVDVYPFTNTGLEPLWLSTYEVVANAALGCGAETAFYMQTQLAKEGMYSKKMTYTDMRMQVYAALAYGAEQLMYYCFTCPAVESLNYEYCMLDPNGEPSDYYGLVQKINQEIAVFENVYTSYSYTGTFPVLSGTNDDVNLQLLANEPQYEDMLYLRSVTADKGILVGTFAREGGEAYMFVNIGETEEGQKAQVTMTLENSNFAALYGKNGAGVNEDVVKGKNGKFSFTLEAGEGLFVVPFGN